MARVSCILMDAPSTFWPRLQPVCGFCVEQCAARPRLFWVCLGELCLSLAVGKLLFSWQGLPFSQGDWEYGREVERTRTASKQAGQTEKETTTDRGGEREIRWSGQTLGLEPRTEARRRNSDSIRLEGGSVGSPILRRGSAQLNLGGWGTDTVQGLPRHLCQGYFL